MSYTSPSSRLIVQYQQHPDDEALHQEARQETMRLLYQIPLRIRLLHEEACSDFLLYCAPSIDRYIAIYDATQLQYEQFIESIVRRRAPALEMRRKKQMDWREAVIHFPSLVTFDTAEETEPSYHPRSRILPLSSMPQCFRYLCEIRPSRIPGSDDTIQRLSEKLSIHWVRKGFILLVTTSPRYCLSSFPSSLALLLGVEDEVLQSYLLTAESVLGPKHDKRTKLLDSVNFHYRRMIQCQWERQYSMAKELELARKAEYNRTILRRKVEELQKQSFSLSHSEVAALVKVARGTVNSGTYCARRIIRECMDDGAAKKYG
jgi:hypothetical protein